MLGATQDKGGTFNLVTLGLNLSCPPKEHVCRGHIVEGLVVTAIVIVVDKVLKGLLEFPGEVVIAKADDVFEGAVVALNLALGHGMAGFPTNMPNIDFLAVLPPPLANIRPPLVHP